jgi:anaerobic magnesium-protoporphyrin IX monomethyl ester cyclase
MKVALVNVTNNNKKVAMNKDLNGGFGTSDEYGNSITSKILKSIKRRSVKLPIIGFAFLQAILKKQHEVKYFENSLPIENYDLILIYGTVVDYKNENNTCTSLKLKFPNSKVGFFGPFPATMPSLFKSGDFVLTGEAEAFFMEEFKDLSQLEGEVKVSSQTDMDALPSPDYTGFPIESYSYSPAISKKPFLVLQASKGCPYTCSYYCVYGDYQGPKIRQRSAKKVVEDIKILQEKHNVKGIQFRDPVFGLNRNFIKEFCQELKDNEIRIEWGMETRLDVLNEENLNLMYDVGLKNLNVGIETNDPKIAEKNKRKLVEFQHQENMIRFAEKLGINVSAFFIIGYDGDTKETIINTINYAIKLNTLLARFAVSTPYPGTS